MNILFVVVGLLLIPLASADDGANLYAGQCAACHGLEGLGDKSLSSPRLAGQNMAYLREQLVAFQEGSRGTHADDIQGRTMRALTLGLSMAQIEAIAMYLAQLGDKAPSQLSGDGEGALLYRDTCGDCHGQYGGGAESIVVPNLAILSRWYLDAQMQAFYEGWRGGASSSARAKNMRSIAHQIPDLEERRAVIGHIGKPDPK